MQPVDSARRTNSAVVQVVRELDRKLPRPLQDDVHGVHGAVSRVQPALGHVQVALKLTIDTYALPEQDRLRRGKWVIRGPADVVASRDLLLSVLESLLVRL